MTLIRAAASLCVVILIECASVGIAQADPADPVSAQCAAMKDADFSRIPDAPTKVIEAKLTEPTGDEPRHCQIRGYVAPQIGFEIQLPVSSWNGKFIEV